MRWIADSEFQNISTKAGMCVLIESGRHSTNLCRLRFDDAMLLTNEFSVLLQKLLKWSGDRACSYIVLDPDPVHYFYRHFHKYPVVEIVRGDSTAEYLACLNQEVDGNRAEAVGTHSYTYAVVPPSLKWFVHAVRSAMDDRGHLWVPPEWKAEILKSESWLFE